jgi:perosamine synthetase
MTHSFNFLSCLKRALPEKHDSLGLHEPFFDGMDADYVAQSVRSGWVSYQGPMVKEFEENLSTYLGGSYVISVVNGTAALFIALKALEIGQGDEVIIPSITFAATANAVHHVGAVPHFVDVSTQTLGIDSVKLDKYLEEIGQLNFEGVFINKKTQRPIKAIIPVHVLGASLNFEELSEVAQKYNLQVVEDAAEALGSNFGQQKLGTIGRLGILSFNGNKIITTGGGGAIVTKDLEMANKIRHIVTTAKIPHAYEFEHDIIGYNFRLPSLNAALGVSQLKKIDALLHKKRTLFETYQRTFKEFEMGEMFDPDVYGKANCWLNAIVLKPECAPFKNEIIESALKEGIALRPLWKPLHMLAMNTSCPRSDCSNAENLYGRVVCVSSSAVLSDV